MRSVSGKAVQLRGAAARARRVSGHIQVTPGKDVAGQAIILIDDIVTTGSTARQCAAVLREAGAKPLTVLALARAGERSQGDLSSVCD
ncbi:hypothetical protein KIMH_05760 [Bombiscardovia apis]|uniref:Phosphoribosyltransferase domain-containing protein n=2 Tax=Bombiscardovia apis TaxID=2932182 RepID=A0ABN6SEK1_9BIFI|nr:hypothetical protein KIMH_05760 [Bombiscardovia apis]